MSLLQAFQIVFESDSSEVEKGAKEAGKSVDKLEDKLVDTDKAAESLGDSFLGVVTSAQGALAGLLSIGAITASVISQAARTDELGKFSETLGLNIEDVGAWSEAVVRSGGDANAFQGTIGSLTDKLTDFGLTGGGATAEVFARLGINARDSGGKIKSAFDVLPELADSFQTLSKTESSALGQKLGLDQGTILLLQQGRMAVDDLVDRQKQLGVATQEDYEIAAKFNDQWADTKQVFGSLAIATGSKLLPSFTMILKGAEKVIFFLSENEDLVVGFFTGAASVITYLYLPAMASAALATLTAIAPFLAIGAAILAVGAAFALIYDDVQSFLSGQDSLIGQFVDALGGVMDTVMETVDDIGEAIDELIEKITGIFKSFSDIAGSVGDFISGIFGEDDVKTVPVKIKPEAIDYDDREFDEIERELEAIDIQPGQTIRTKGDLAKALEAAGESPLNGMSSQSIINQGAASRSTTVSVGSVSVDARGGDSQEIAAGVGSALGDQMQQTVSQFDDGVAY